MTTHRHDPTVGAGAARPPVTPSGHDAPRRVRSRLTQPRPPPCVAIVIALLWTIPTFGLFVSSFRPEDEIKTTGWWTFFADPQLTLENYQRGALRLLVVVRQLASYFINSLAITIPAVLFPLALAALAAYALAWINFRGRDWLFIGDLRAADRAAADGAGPAAEFFSTGVTVGGVQVLPAWNLVTSRVRPGVVRAHLLRPAARRSSCCTTSSRSSPAT